MYEYNMSTKDGAKGSEKEPKKLVDLKIDGSKGPTPKIVYPKHQKHKVWVDNGAQIDSFELTTDKMKRMGDVVSTA